MSKNVSEMVQQFFSGTLPPPEAADPTSVQEEDVWRAEDSTVDGEGMDALAEGSTGAENESQVSEDTPKDSQVGADAKAQGKPGTPDKEIVTITDESGVRRKIEIDYSNREQLKKSVLLANGARKWQAERDKALKARESLEKEYSELKNNLQFLDQAYSQGPEALFDTLAGKQGAFQEYVARKQEREEFLKHASPAEKEAFEARELADKQSRELEKLRKEQEEFRKSVMTEKEKAEESALLSQLTPVFDKYRFADKLGNPEGEELLDQAIWNRAVEQLTEYEKKNIPLSRDVVDKVFRQTAQAVQKSIAVKAEKTAQKVIAQKKQEAVENVQAKVMSGYKSGGTASEAQQLLQKGDITSLMKGWGKYGSLFGKK